MTILAISRDWGTNPCIVRIEDNSNLSTISAAGYVFTQTRVISAIQKGTFEWVPTDEVLISYDGGQGYFSFNPVTGSFIPQASSGGGVTEQQVQTSSFNYSTASGSNDALIATLVPAVTALTDGLTVTLSSESYSNTTSSPTLQINALTPVPITTFAGTVAAGDIQPNQKYLFVYNENANEFQLTNPSRTTADTFQVQSSSYNYALDTGILNAYIGNVVPAQSSLTSGFIVMLQAINTNTGASTLTVNGTTAPIVLTNGSGLSGGEIIAGRMSLLIYNDNLDVFQLMNGVISSGGAFAWSNKASNFTAAANNGYIATAALTATLPIGTAAGQTISLMADSAGALIIRAPVGQTIRLGSISSSAAGTVTNSAQGDTITLVYSSSSTSWITLNDVGNSWSLV